MAGHLTAHLDFVARPGGSTDRVSIVLRQYRDPGGVRVGLDVGTCHYV